MLSSQAAVRSREQGDGAWGHRQVTTATTHKSMLMQVTTVAVWRPLQQTAVSLGCLL